MNFKEGIKEASPIKLHEINNKTHVTVQLGMLVRGVVIVAMAVMAYMNFMGRFDRLESENQGLKKQIVVRDSLMRKDIRLTLEALHKDLSTSAAELGTAVGTDMIAAKTALATEAAARVAATKANSEMIALEMDNLKSLIISANSTTNAELQPAIRNVQNALDLQMEALSQRISLIEGQIQEQVKQSFWKFGKK